MLHFPRWKILSVVGTCLLGLLLSIPNLFPKDTVKNWPSYVPHLQMPFGLDLQGGAHILLAANSDELKKDWLKKLRLDARKVVISDGKMQASVAIVGNSVQVRMTKPEQTDAAIKELRAKVVQPVGNVITGATGNDIELTKAEGGVIIMTPTEQGFVQRQSNAIGASMETIGERVHHDRPPVEQDRRRRIFG